MTITPASRRRRLKAISGLFALLLAAEATLAAIAALVVNLQRRGNMSNTDAAVFDLLGASAVAGTIIAMLAMAGCVAAVRGQPHRLLTASRTLAWLRLAAIPIAVWTIAAVIGVDAVVGLPNVSIIGFTLLVAACGVYGTGSAHRLASPAK